MTTVLGSQKVTLMACGLLPFPTDRLLPNLPPWLRYLVDNSLTLVGLANLVHLIVFVNYALFFVEGFRFEERFAQLQDVMAISTSLVYVAVFLLKKDQIVGAIRAVEENLPHRSLAGLFCMKMDACVERARSFSNRMTFFFVLGTIYHGLQPVLRGHYGEQFPFRTVYPGKWAYQSPQYECLFFVQMVGQVHLGLLFASFMALFVSVARIITVQYEMLLVSIRNIPSSALIRNQGDKERARRCLRRLFKKWQETKKVGREYFEGEELQDEKSFFINQETSTSLQVDDQEDLFECGEYDQEVLQAIIECVQRHSLIRRICAEVEDMLSFNMLNTIGMLIICLCFLIYVLLSIGSLNESTVDFANYFVLGYFEMFIMCYYPHLMSYQVSPLCSPWTLRAH